MLFHVFGHVNPHECAFIVEDELRERFGRLGLPHPGGAEEDERANRSIRVLQAGARAPNSIGNRDNRLVLANDTLSEVFLELREALTLGFQQTCHRYSCPLAYDSSDVVRLNFLLQILELLLELGQPSGCLPDRLFCLRNLSVVDFRSTVEITGPRGPVGFASELLHVRPEGLNLLDDVLLGLPPSFHALAFLTKFGKLDFDRLLSFTGGSLRLVLQGLSLDLELNDPALDFIDLLGQRVDLDA